MDAAADDRDVKLYRASGDLIPELRVKLPKLLWHQVPGKRRKVRLRVLYSKTADLVSLFDRFQEWPQLLDQHLTFFLETLVAAFLAYLTEHSESYSVAGSTLDTTDAVVPLPLAICELLYVLCKVRGQKVIVRFLNSEPKYIEPLLASLRLWNSQDTREQAQAPPHMTWEERYIMLLWLSHLMFAPFDLATISAPGSSTSSQELQEIIHGLPDIARDLLAVAFEYLYIPSKEREAASALIVRLVLRGDMQRHQLHTKTVKFVISQLMRVDGLPVQPYKYVGLLSILSGILTTGSDDDVAGFLVSIFQTCSTIATSESHRFAIIRDSAPVRKLLIKTMRLSVLHAVSLSCGKTPVVAAGQLEIMLEESIQYFLDALGDKDTPIRMAASKHLAMIAMKLDAAMSMEINQAVLESFNENMLLENKTSSLVVAVTDISVSDASEYRRNLSAVDPLRWQGLMLTLGHLLFRRSPNPDQLAVIISTLISGLEFEQRSNAGSSIGVGVRDAACFGMWSLSRKYSTKELAGVDRATLLSSSAPESGTVRFEDALQVLATQLVISSCFDPSGNIRRGSSAALQELIGRHPDNIVHGIALVQIVDYHAVARRSYAMSEVALQVARLGPIYQDALLGAVLEWRCARAADPESRRWAAEAIGRFSTLLSVADLTSFCEDLRDQLTQLQVANTGATASIRHGLLLALAGAVRSTTSSSEARQKSVLSIWDRVPGLVGSLDGRVTRELEFVLEAASTLIGSLATQLRETGGKAKQQLLHASVRSKALQANLTILDRCITGTEKDFVVDAAASAFSELFRGLSEHLKAEILQTWLLSDQGKGPEYRSKGRIESIGKVFEFSAEALELPHSQDSIVRYLTELTSGSWPIETKVNAMFSVTVVVRTLASATNKASGATNESSDSIYELVAGLGPTVWTGLRDYTIDQRGDVGSLLRLQSIEAVNALVMNEDLYSTHTDRLQPLLQQVTRLALEKLDKVRFQAWLCMERFWRRQIDFPELSSTFQYPADVSTVAYYQQILGLLQIDWLQTDVILGLISSCVGGTEELCRHSRSAFIACLEDQSPEVRKSTVALTLGVLSQHIARANEDRDIISAVEFLAFLLDQGVTTSHSSSIVAALLHKLQPPSSSLQKTEASIMFYAALLSNADEKTRALDRLTRLLLHRYPKIRNLAADMICFHTNAAMLNSVDWATPVAGLKPKVIRLRKELGIVQK